MLSEHIRMNHSNLEKYSIHRKRKFPKVKSTYLYSAWGKNNLVRKHFVY